MTLSLILSALVLAAPAWADHGAACREDARRLCPKDSGPQRLRCLEAHNKELSPACRENLKRMRAEGEEFKKDCRGDSGKLCPGQEGHKLMDCLEADLARLSSVCAERVRKIQAERRVVKERIPAECREDSDKLCAAPGACPDGVLAGLKAAPAKLSEPCRAALAEPAK